MPRAPVRKIDVRFLLGLFAAAVIAGIWGVTIFQLRSAETTELQNAEQDARSLARLFEEHATRTIEAADQAVSYLRLRYNTLGTALDINQDLKNGLNPGDIYTLFSIVDENADVLLSSQPFKPLNLRDREHIRVHMESDSVGLFISKPLLGRVSNKWSIQMTRRISHPDGSFKGVVVVSMDPQYFTRLYHEIDVGQHGAISLVGTDGIARVRRVGNADAMGQDISGSPLFARMQQAGSGLERATSPIDGRDRIYAFERLKHYPLFVYVGIDVEERLAAYRKTRNQATLLASITTALIMLFTAGLIYMVGRVIASREAAVAANVAKTRFLSNMSHELRTPLNGVLGYSELLLEELAGTPEVGAAAAIHDCGKRLLSLVDSVLELSALESGKAVLMPSEENLRELMEQVVEKYRGAASAKRLGLTLTVSADAPGRLLCDRAKLLRVMYNLIDNAVKFTDEGSVRINVHKANDGLLFAVSDTGRGIPVDMHEQIFSRFAQVDDRPSRAKDGAGLGLAVANRLVELMGSRISLRSHPGAGSTFSFSLSLAHTLTPSRRNDRAPETHIATAP